MEIEMELAFDGLPMSAVALNDDGRPWYPYRLTPGSPVLFLENPVLTAPGAHWAPCPTEFLDRPHTDLDEVNVAELLYFDTDEPGSLLDRLGRVLARTGCDVHVMAGWLACDYGDFMYDLHANLRMQDRREVSHRLFSPVAG